MFKWFALFLILTVAVGYYWLVMTGTLADRSMDLQVKGAIKEVTVPGIANRLRAMQERIDLQEQQVKQLSFVARDPDWSHVEQARREVDGAMAMADRLLKEGLDDTETEAAQPLRDRVKELTAVTVETFHPRQRTFWAVLFWLFAVPTLLFGLLSFLRAAPG